MNKRGLVVLTVGAVALVVAGGLFASNMGFKLNYGLDGPGPQAPALPPTGIHDLALPYNQQTSLVTAADVRADVNATVPGSFASLARWVTQLDVQEVYTGGATFPQPGSNVNFNLTPGDGYRIKVSAPVNYIIVGSHDPGLVLNFIGPGPNAPALPPTGLQGFGYPYHATAATASDLRNEINAVVPGGFVSLARWVYETDVQEVYTGGSTFPQPGSNVNFALTPGAGYRIKVSTDVAYVPSHY